MFGVTILGNNSALPAFDRHPTAQIVTLQNNLLLIDCGEGTQMQLSRYKIKRSRINHIFISHLHGDHYFGLIGLLTSMGLLGREQPLNLYATPALKDIIDMQLGVANVKLPYELRFHPLAEEGLIVDNASFTVHCFKTIHRIECFGFYIKEKNKQRKINKDIISNFKIPSHYFEALKDGKDFIQEDGVVVPNELLTLPAPAAKSYAYCADTVYDELLPAKVQHADLLYHETTYLSDHEEKAAARFHSTTVQAASIAHKASAKKLLIGHFSSKYEDVNCFLDECAAAFTETQLAIEGVTYLV